MTVVFDQYDLIDIYNIYAPKCLLDLNSSSSSAGRAFLANHQVKWHGNWNFQGSAWLDIYVYLDRMGNSGGGPGCSRAMIRATRPTRKTTSTGEMCRKPSMQMLVGCFQGNIKSAGALTKGSFLHGVVVLVHSSFRKQKTWAHLFFFAVTPSWTRTISQCLRFYLYTPSWSKRVWESGSTGVPLLEPIRLIRHC